MGAEEGQRDREKEFASRLRAMSAEPDVGLDLMNGAAMVT